MSTFSPRSSFVTIRTREPAGPDAGADRVDVGVVRPHGDLGAVTGLAGRRLDLHDAVEHLRDLELEEPLDQPGVGPAHDDLRALGGLAHLDDVRLETARRARSARTGPARPAAAAPRPCPRSSSV